MTQTAFNPENSAIYIIEDEHYQKLKICTVEINLQTTEWGPGETALSPLL